MFENEAITEPELHPTLPWWSRLILFLQACLGLNQEPMDETFARRIHIEVVEHGHMKCFFAIAILDTGCPVNLMSQELALKLGFTPESNEGVPILEALGGGEFRTIGQVKGRWSCRHNLKRSCLGFDPRYYDDTWEVSSKPGERYDVIIGRETITKYALLKVKRELAAPAAYRTLPAEVDCMHSLLPLERLLLC